MFVGLKCLPGIISQTHKKSAFSSDKSFCPTKTFVIFRTKITNIIGEKILRKYVSF